MGHSPGATDTGGFRSPSVDGDKEEGPGRLCPKRSTSLGVLIEAEFRRRKTKMGREGKSSWEPKKQPGAALPPHSQGAVDG